MKEEIGGLKVFSENSNEKGSKKKFVSDEKLLQRSLLEKRENF